MSTGILLVSHGEFAKAALGSAEMIAGKQHHVIALSLDVDKTLEELEKEVDEAYHKLKADCETIIALCDIYGGSPFNAISRCLLKGMNMLAYTGLNLPILIDLLLSKDMLAKEEITEHMMEVHQNAFSMIQVNLVNDDDISDL